LAVRLGATHVGCVLVPESPRGASLEQAKRVFDAAGDNVRHVLVFRGESPSTILEMARCVGTTDFQIPSPPEEDALLLEREDMTVYRVQRVDPGARQLPVLTPPPSPERPVLLDVGGGGSGQAFRWEILGAEAPSAVFIAGGIRPENIGELLSHRPYGVDLSSGVEARPGIKDPNRLAAFFEELERSS
jgi:phosphoribosylanthranilate isomerase